MSRPKRKRGVETVSPDTPPTKTQRTERRRMLSDFWDNLSKVPFCCEALRELDRRTKTRPLAPVPVLVRTKDLGRFSRHGGPDLTHLRGHRRKTDISKKMASRVEAMKRDVEGASAGGSGTTSTKSITPYNPAFAQNLTDHDVHPPRYHSPRYDLPPEFDAVVGALSARRSSFSLETVSEDQFDVFAKTVPECQSEEEVKVYVMPEITGPLRRAEYPQGINTIFNKMKPLTDGTLSQAKPDMWYVWMFVYAL